MHTATKIEVANRNNGLLSLLLWCGRLLFANMFLKKSASSFQWAVWRRRGSACHRGCPQRTTINATTATTTRQRRRQQRRPRWRRRPPGDAETEGVRQPLGADAARGGTRYPRWRHAVPPPPLSVAPMLTRILASWPAADSPWRHGSVADPTAAGGAREGTTAAATTASGGAGDVRQAPPALRFPGVVPHRLPRPDHREVPSGGVGGRRTHQIFGVGPVLARATWPRSL